MSKTRIAVTSVAVAALLLAGSPTVNSLLQKGYLGERPRRLAQFLVPKPDLYQPLFREAIDVGTSGAAFHYRFRNRYAGRHTLGLLAHGEIALERPASYTGTLALSIACRDEAGVRYERQAVGSLSPWWGPPTRGKGFDVFMYTVPKDLPLGRPVDCEVMVQTGDPTFASRFDIYAFYAHKESEE